MKQKLLLTFLIINNILWANTEIAAPANDNFANAIPITCGNNYTASTVEATIDEDNAPDSVSPAVDLDAPNIWYSYTGSGIAEIVTLDLCASGYDTSYLVYTGTSGNLTLVAANDDNADQCGPGYRSYGTFESDGTTTYYITITGYGPASIGAVDLTVSCIPVGAEEIPDSNFEQALIDAGLDTGPVDGYIFPAALDQVTALNISNKSISDLTGIEFFTSLQTLNCSNNNLTALDISANTGITTLNCSFNSIATLNLINLPNLNLLLCNNNQLTSLNVKNGNNANFIAFSASGNSNLTCIEVDNPTYSTENWSSIDTGVTFEVFCDAVTYIPDNNFEQNLIDRGLDDVLDDYVVTANINTITAVDISNSNVADLTGIEDFTALRFLYAYGNQISSVDVTQNTALEVFEINGNNISTIDLTQNTALVDLQIWSNPITTIDLTQNVALEKANFQHCQLTAIDVSQNIALKELSVIFNTQISTINVSTNINLEELGLTSTQVSTLDLTNNPNLQELFLANCPIATVDISTNLALEFLNISGTQIQDINLSNHPAFDALFAENTTALTNINVQNGNNTNFRFFYTRNTPNLECVQVDDVAYSTTNWTFVDTGINFSTFCAAGVNDECVNAIDIPISSVSCDNVVAATMQDATDSNSLHCFGDDANFSDVWFSFVATETSHVVKLQNLTGSPDFLWHTVIDAQTYNCGNITNAIYCTDALEDTATGLTVGNTYYVQVYSHEANANTIFDICVSPVVPANQVYVPDDNFEQALIDLGYDTVLDDLVLRANVNTVTALDVINKNITDLTGIEAFVSLQELYVDNNNITTTINLSQNPLLETFFAENNGMATLDVTQNPLLETIYIGGNSLSILDVTQNPLLESLFLESNSLSALDVTQNPLLRHLAIRGNNVSTLNITQNPLLIFISASDNALTTIDLSQNPLIKQAYFAYNQLSAIDVSQNTMLEELKAFNNSQIQSIDVAANPNLKELNVSFTQVTTVDVSNNLVLEKLSFVNCPVTEIDVTANTALTSLDIAGTLVPNIDVSQNPVFEILSCRDNSILANVNMQNGNNANVSLFLATDTPNLSCIQVDNVAYSTANWTSVDTGVNFSTSCPTLVYVPDDNFEQALIDLGYDNTIDDYVLASNINTITSLSISDKNIADLTGIQGFTALEELYVFNNPLGSLNLTQNPALELLNANNTSLTTIDLTQNPALQFLSIESNSLTTIDITQNPALISASFQSNQLTAIDVSQNATLENLNLVQNTQLANLDVSANPNLITLNLNFTQISSLDVANNSNLETISAASCPITTLNVSNNLNLKILSLVGTPIKKIDVSNNPIFESLYVSNCSDLTGINIQNGNNANIQFFFTISTPSLTCVQVDDVAYSTANWGNVDTGTNFSIDCGFLENDECVDAIDIPISNVLCNTTVAGTLLQASDSNVFQCFGNTDFSDVWYSFVATETTHNVKILNTSGSNSRVFHAVIDAQTYTCGNITDAIYCTDSTEGQATNLTIGNKYFVQVYTDVANSTETFDICVSTTSSPGLTYVPDDNFEQALIDLGLDTVLDDYVVTSNINTVNDLNVRNLSIFDLTGIEDFAALEILNCGLNFLGELDLSNNTNLNYLIADNAALVGLNVKNGNNMNVTTFITLGNVDLFCVQVDDAAYSTTNWTIIEGTTSFSEFCGDPIQVAAKVYLQGAMLQHTDGSMRTDLNDNNLVSSISSPYADGIGASDNVFLATGQDKVVDWIWIELRDATNPTTIIEGKSAILQRDGDIVDATADDASTPVSFNQDAGDYHIVIKHRNHLGIMSNSALALSTTVTAVDFTDGNNQITYGTNAQTTFGMPANSVAMWCGNVNGDNVVQYSGTNPDVPTILSTVLNNPDNFLNFPTYVVSGYDTNDVNMDGSVQYAGTNPDTPFILQNIFAHPGNFLNFSTYQITEQLPQSE